MRPFALAVLLGFAAPVLTRADESITKPVITAVKAKTGLVWNSWDVTAKFCINRGKAPTTTIYFEVFLESKRKRSEHDD